MRKIIFTKVLLLFCVLVNAQCVINNGTLNSSCIGDGYNTSNQCVSNWLATHGTPTAMGTVGGNTWVWLWSHSNTGEGIRTSYNFQSGKTYLISFRVRATTNISNPNSTVLNSRLNVRAASGLSSTNTTGIPNPTNVQTIWSETVANVGSTWRTISLFYTPTSNFSALWLYPLITADSGANNSAQIQMEVDDITVNSAINASLFFQNAAGTRKTDFCPGEDVYMNGTNSIDETQYYIDIWRRPIGSTGAFQWQTQLGTNGWTLGQVGVLNLSNLFAAQNYFFVDGFEYQVKLAVGNSCVPWVEATRTFRVLSNNASPAFTFVSSCAPNGTISVSANATDTTAGLNHWWALMESNAQGATSDAATIGQVGLTQSGNTVTFTGLSRTKFYYIKHGVYSTCVNWTEQRTALPQNVSWSNYTTNFNLAPSSNLNGNVTVTAAAHNNPVFVNHHWSIFYAPNGSTTGNSNVPGNPDQCCTNASATFSANLVVNQWYYIKHGVWNDCMPWNETRKAFRVVIQGLLADGSPNYAIEESLTDEKTKARQANETVTQEETVLYPNPVTVGEKLTLTTACYEVTEVKTIDYTGNTRILPFSKTNDKAIEMSVSNQYKPGIYTLKLSCKEGKVITKKLVIK